MTGSSTDMPEPVGIDLAIDRAYRALHFLLDKVVARIAAIILLSGTLLACIEIVRRYILGVVFDWGQDAVTYISIAAVFIYFAVTQASRSHLAVLALLDLLRSRGYVRIVLAIRVFVSGISLTLFTALAYWGIPAVERAEKLGRTTQSMVILIWPFQACLVIAFALMALVTLFHLYQDAQALRGKTVFPWAPVEEGIEI